VARKFTAEVKEGPTGQPYVIVQPDSENGLPDNKRIRIDFPDGTPIETAEETARTLNKRAENISVVAW
jgi:hypothetical protein